MKQFKIVVEKHPDGYVAYPLGLNGIVVGEGNDRISVAEVARLRESRLTSERLE